MPVPRRENHSEEMTDRIRDEQKACSLSGFFLQRKCTFLFQQEDDWGIGQYPDSGEGVCAADKAGYSILPFNQMMAAYLRNDKNPALATGAVLAGGIFNIFGDYFFVFVCDMGAYGAGLATAIGSAIL